MPLAVLTRLRRPAVSTKRQISSSSSTSESTGSTVVPATESTTARCSPVSRLSRLDLPTFGLPTSATRRGPPLRAEGLARRLGQRVEDGVEQVAGAAAVQGADRAGLAEAERPQRGRVGEQPVVVDLVGGQQHRALGAAQHPRDGLVGGGRADGRVDDEQDGVGGLHRDLGLRGDRALQALGAGLPAAGVDDGELAAVPQRVVGDPVPGHARERPARPPPAGRGCGSPASTCPRSACRRRRAPARAIGRLPPRRRRSPGRTRPTRTRRTRCRPTARWCCQSRHAPPRVHARAASSSRTRSASVTRIRSVPSASPARPLPISGSNGLPASRSTTGRNRRRRPGGRCRAAARDRQHRRPDGRASQAAPCSASATSTAAAGALREDRRRRRRPAARRPRSAAAPGRARRDCTEIWPMPAQRRARGAPEQLLLDQEHRVAAAAFRTAAAVRSACCGWRRRRSGPVAGIAAQLCRCDAVGGPVEVGADPPAEREQPRRGARRQLVSGHRATGLAGLHRSPALVEQVEQPAQHAVDVERGRVHLDRVVGGRSGEVVRVESSRSRRSTSSRVAATVACLPDAASCLLRRPRGRRRRRSR